MSNISDGSQVDVVFPENVVIPTYYTNLIMVKTLEEEVYIDFCIRSAERPLVRADLQCRMMTNMAHLRQMNDGLTQLIAQYDQQVQQRLTQAQAQSEAQQAAEAAKAMAAQQLARARAAKEGS